jgi:hypothetical protein
LVPSVPEAEGVPRFELDEAVVALGVGVGDPSDQVDLDTVPPVGLGKSSLQVRLAFVGMLA